MQLNQKTATQYHKITRNHKWFEITDKQIGGRYKQTWTLSSGIIEKNIKSAAAIVGD